MASRKDREAIAFDPKGRTTNTVPGNATKGTATATPAKAHPSKAKPAKTMSGKTSPGSPAHKPEEISPYNIRRNEQNPRIEFNADRIRSLGESIEDQGMLVPVTVYRDPDGETEFVLLDGERRWRAAQHINKETIPAWVIGKPDGIENIVTMFNIHMMREDWGEMATTLALKKIIDQTGEDNVDALRKLTGLTKDRINSAKRVLTFPASWHDRVLDESIPYNLLIELDKAVLSKARDPKKKDVLGLTEAKLRDLFLKKYDDKSLGDVVDLRKVGVLIDTAASRQVPENIRDRAKRAISDLLKKKDASIEEAYQYGAAASVEIKNILRDVDHLPDRLADIADADLPREDRARLVKALQNLKATINSVVTKLSHA